MGTRDDIIDELCQHAGIDRSAAAKVMDFLAENAERLTPEVLSDGAGQLSVQRRVRIPGGGVGSAPT